MEHRIVFATGNEGKMREVRLILADLGMEILSMKEAGADPDIVEAGKTFGENAEIKARAVWEQTGGIVLADEISPDTCRFWDMTTGEKLDKDRFRRDMGGVEDAYKEVFKRLTEAK